MIDEPPIADYDRQHWSFSPLIRPEPPHVVDAGWCRTPVDRFILAALQKAGLTPLPPADRVTLIRRVTFDLTGLPPTPQEVEEFRQDATPEAYDKLLTRLLATRAYAERSAQHWLDLARFAETDGYEHDKVRSQAWKYRDWVIDAFDRDLPYDEFLRLQLAADEFQPADDAAAIATGFLLCGPDMPDINDQDERRHVVLNEMTSTVGAALMGLQLGCAQCHDHKYDPLSQADFYRLRAVFEPAVPVRSRDQPFGNVLFEKGSQAPATYLMLRGDFRRPGPPVEPAFPRIANPWSTAIPQAEAAAKSTGRRRALATWLTRPDHPLSTRVMANRLWQQHFVHGLVRTPSDFGLMGETPSHPQLLDWLATELPRQGWSLKQMHRLLLNSAVYRQASRPASPEWNAEQTAQALASWQQSKSADPANRLLARMNRQRLDGEAIRDAMLASADRLSPRRGGPGVMPPLPQEVVASLLKGQWQVSPDEEDHRRRSIYLFVRRNLRYPLFEVFDRPDTNASCPKRDRSTTAPQALWQFNSEFSLAAARDLATYLQAQAGSDLRAQINLAYRRCLGRAATTDELATAEEFPAKAAPDTAMTHFCLALFNLNEFIYVD